MHAAPIDPSRRTATSRRKAATAGSDRTLFASHLTDGIAADASVSGQSGDFTALGAATAAGPASALDALLGAQEINGGCDPAIRRATARYASDLLDQLEQVRRDVLDGRVPADRLTELARALREDKQRSHDPELDDIVEAVELRAEVELAKLRYAR